MNAELDKELLKKVRQIDIQLRRKVNHLFSGQYRSAFKGQGMIFSDFREYVPGDDVRAISWNVTAKMSRPIVKTFEEDRETQILLVVDASSSLDFGVGEQSKAEVVNLLTSLVAFCAQKNQDSVGLLIFSGDVDLYIPPKRGVHHTLRIIREICNRKNKKSQTGVHEAFGFLQKVLNKRSHIFLFSDFLWPFSFEHSLRQLGNRHDIISVVISDLFEREIPNLGLVDMEDLETGKNITVDFSSLSFQKHHKRIMAEARMKRSKELLRSRSEQIFVDTSKDIYEPFIRFFQKRIQGHVSVMQAK